MIVCVCNAVSDKEIKAWRDAGGSSLGALQYELGVGTCCGKCKSCASDILCSGREQEHSPENQTTIF